MLKGPVYDLPIAIALLADMGMFLTRKINTSIFFGELVDGTVRAVTGVCLAIMARDKIQVTVSLQTMPTKRPDSRITTQPQPYPVKSLRKLSPSLRPL